MSQQGRGGGGGCTHDLPYPEAQRPRTLPLEFPLEAAIIVALDCVE